MVTLIAQGWLPYGILELVIIAIVLGGAWYILTNVLTLPPKFVMVLNVLIVVILAVFAIRVLASLL